MRVEQDKPPVVNVVVKQLNIPDEEEWKEFPTRLGNLEQRVEKIEKKLKEIFIKLKELSGQSKLSIALNFITAIGAIGVPLFLYFLG